jgi:two-component system, cell cycle sensor histidine kinase PleC
MQTAAFFSMYTRRRLKRRLGALTALIVLSILALLAAAIFKAREDAIARARLEASYIAATLSDDVEGALDTLSCASGFVKESIETGRTVDFLPRLQEQISRNAPSLTAISVIGADGKIRESSAPGAVDSADYSSVDFFHGQMEAASNGLKFGRPITIGGHPIIPATRRLETKSGEFAGVVLFSIDPEIAAAAYRQVHLGDTGAFKIVGTNGIIYAGYARPRGFDPSLIGTSFFEKPLMHWRLGDAGTFIANSPYDGIERVYYWRRIPEYPLIAVAGIGKAEALKGANREAILVGGLGMLSAGLLLIMTLVLKREFARRFRQALALDSQRRKLRETNAKLIAAKRQAEEANESKSLFLANISHELRTPLNAILGFAEIIRDRIFGTDLTRYSAYAADIYESGMHLLAIVGSLLDLSKIEAGKFELKEGLIRVDGILRESLRVVSAQAALRGVTLAEPPACHGIAVYADATALKQIVINLLANAIKFTGRGGLVSLSSSLASDGSLVVAIKDTGIGMTEGEITEALEPFRQIHSGLVARPEGTGLGLPLAAKLAGLHGGTLRIESTPGSGTTASVRLPPWRVRPWGDAFNTEPAAAPSA